MLDFNAFINFLYFTKFVIKSQTVAGARGIGPLTEVLETPGMPLTYAPKVSSIVFAVEEKQKLARPASQAFKSTQTPGGYSPINLRHHVKWRCHNVALRQERIISFIFSILLLF